MLSYAFRLMVAEIFSAVSDLDAATSQLVADDVLMCCCFTSTVNS